MLKTESNLKQRHITSPTSLFEFGSTNEKKKKNFFEIRLKICKKFNFFFILIEPFIFGEKKLKKLNSFFGI